MLENKKIDVTKSYGRYVETSIDNLKLLFHEGVNLRYRKGKSEIPDKHHILIKFSDGTYLCVVTRMYRGIDCFKENTLGHTYYIMAKEKPNPLSSDFDKKYFNTFISNENVQKISIKEFLSTE